MTDHHPQQTTVDDDAFLTVAGRLRERISSHPFALGFLAVCAAAGIFLLGTYVGEAIYLAF